jgi:hypothetical protein
MSSKRFAVLLSVLLAAALLIPASFVPAGAWKARCLVSAFSTVRACPVAGVSTRE